MMLSPRKAYISPQMQTADLSTFSGQPSDRLKAQFAGLSPSEAARLFSELMHEQA